MIWLMEWRTREKRNEKPCAHPLSPVPYGANIQPVAIKSEINSFCPVDQKFTADNSMLNMLFCDEDWNPFLWPPWQTEGEMACACPPAQAVGNYGLGDGDAFVSTVHSQGWNDSASLIRQQYLKQTEKGSWARRYLVWHVFRQKLLWPLGYLCLCKAGDGRAGGGRLLPAPGSNVGRAYSACFP